MLRTMRLCFLVWMLATACGCERSAFAFWGCSYMNLGGETFSDVVISYDHHRWELGDDFRGGGAEKYMGVAGRMPRAVDIGVTSKDGRRHHIYVVIPRRPAWYRHRTSRIYLVTESRCRAIATWDDLGDMYYRHHPSKLRPRMNWSCAVADEAKEPFSHVMLTVGGTSYPLGAVGPKSDASLSALGPMPKALTISFTSPDGKRHKVRVQAAAASTFHGSKTPELYVLIGSHTKLIAGWRCPQLLKYRPPPIWMCGLSNKGGDTLSHVTIAYDGKVRWPGGVVENVFRRGNGEVMVVDGRMAKTVDLGFTTPDGRRHTVHIVLPSPVNYGSKKSEIDLVIQSGDNVTVSEKAYNGP